MLLAGERVSVTKLRSAFVTLLIGSMAILASRAARAEALPPGSFPSSSPVAHADPATGSATALDESFRLTLPLGSPRRYATRFLKATRTLQIRVAPARADEFKGTEFFDTRYVRRVVVEERAGEVVLSLQLRNLAMGWLVSSKDSPWRLVLDVWRAGPVRNETLAEQWDWQGDASAPTSTNDAGPSTSKGQPDDAASGVPEVDGRGLVGSATGHAAGSIDVRSSNGTRKGTEQVVVDIPPLSSETRATTAEAGAPLNASSAAGRGAPDALGRPELVLSGLFGPLERRAPVSQQRTAALQTAAGAALGKDGEFDRLEALAAEEHRTGRDTEALAVYRKLAVLSERRFLERDETLWRAGESAFLAGNFDAAHDYMRALLARHPGSALASQARVRLTDMELLLDPEESNRSRPGKRYADAYAQVALAETSTLPARAAATVRLLEDVVAERPVEAVRYRQNLNACATSDRIPIEMQKSCAYIQTRVTLESADVASADAAVQAFRIAHPQDARGEALEAKVHELVKSFLNESLRARTWDAWVRFERQARPALLDFTLKDPELAFARADAFETVGENAKAAALYNLHWQNANDGPRRDEAAAQAALLAAKSNDARRRDLNLRRLQESLARKEQGLNDRSVAAIRALSLSPYRNARALSMLLDELRYGRYVERELAALLQYAAQLRRSPSVDPVIERILQSPVKSAEDAAQVEKALMVHADDLRDANRLPKSAETYLAVANIARGTRRAEAAYKAGIALARAGQLEKAKQAWQLAAGDLNDKRYSGLANERLERLR